MLFIEKSPWKSKHKSPTTSIEIKSQMVAKKNIKKNTEKSGNQNKPMSKKK